MSEISGTITHSIYYGSRGYPSPLTITNSGYIGPTSTGSGYAVIGTGGGQLFNQGTITGANAGKYGDGGVDLLSTGGDDYLNNSGSIIGSLKALETAHGSVINSGSITVTEPKSGVAAGSYGVIMTGGTFTNTATGYLNDGVGINILNEGKVQNATVINRGTIANQGFGDGVGLNSDFGFYGNYTAGSGTVIDSGTISETNTVGWAVYFGGATDLLDLEAGYRLIGATAMAYAKTTATSATVELSNYNGAPVTVNFAPTSFTHFHTVEFDPASTYDGTLGLAASGDAPATISGFTGAGDHIDLSFISDANNDATAVLVGDTLTVTGDNGSTTLNLDPAGDYSHLKFLATQDGAGTLVTPEVVCFCRGTHILTPRGEVPIEALSVGDLVVTATGDARAIKWLGHRSFDAARHPDPGAVWPVCISAGALHEGKPARDLRVTRGHSFLIEDVLIQAEKLINGVTIFQEPCDQVEIWHLELESHDIVVAEGVLSESYLDTGNRTSFHNGGAFLDLHPDFKPKRWSETCAPLMFDGPQLVRAKAAILEIAAQRGHTLTPDADLHVLVDGKRIEPEWLTETRAAFMWPARSGEAALRSRSFVPAHCHPWSQDDRQLGVAVGRLQINGADVAIEDTALSTGWNAFERHENGDCLRWTTGETPLPAHARLLVIDIAASGYYWAETRKDNVVAWFDRGAGSKAKAG